MSDQSIRTIELLDALKKLRLLNDRMVLPQKEFSAIEQALINKIGQSEEIVENRLEGLRAEDEFLLVCMVLGTMENVIPLPQKNYLGKDYTIPDFLITIKNNEKEQNVKFNTFLVETKKMSENEKEYTISVNYMKKIKEYAKIMDRPLYFAIKADLTEYNFHQWMLVPSTFIEEKGKKKKIKLHGSRNEKCYVIEVLDLYAYDHFGILLKSPNIILPEGHQYITTYSMTQPTFIRNEEKGWVNKITMKCGSNEKTVEFGEHIDDNRNLVFYELCGFLCGRKIIETTGKEFSTKIIESEYLYSVPFYQIVIETYLSLRGEFYRVLDNIDIEDRLFYAENYSIMDQNIIAYIKDVIYELYQSNIILLITMTPNERQNHLPKQIN